MFCCGILSASMTLLFTVVLLVLLYMYLQISYEDVLSQISKFSSKISVRLHYDTISHTYSPDYMHVR